MLAFRKALLFMLLVAIFSLVACKKYSRVLVVGASGRLGRAIVEKLSKRGVELRCLVRNLADARAISQLHGSELALGDVGDPSSLDAAMQGCDAVISVHGVRPPRPSQLSDLWTSVERQSGGPYLINYIGTRNIVEAMKKAGVTKLLRVTGALVGRPAYFPFSIIFNMLLSSTIQMHLRTETMIRKEGIDYTVLRPTGIREEPSAAATRNTSLVLLQGDGDVHPSLPGKISIEDLSDLCVGVMTGDFDLSRTTVVCSSSSSAKSSAPLQTSWGPLVQSIVPDNLQFKLPSVLSHKLVSTACFSIFFSSILVMISKLLTLLTRFVSHT